MPLDLSVQQKGMENSLDELLRKRIAGLPQDIQGIKSNVEGTRDLTASVSPFLKGLGVQPSGVADLNQFQGNRLSRELSKRLSGTELNRGRTILGQQSDNAARRVGQATTLRRGAEDFSRNQQALTAEQEFQAQQGVLDRQAAFDKANVSEDFTNRGLANELAYAPEYRNATARLLAGITGAVGTGYILNKYGGRTALTTPTSSYIPSSYSVPPQELVMTPAG